MSLRTVWEKWNTKIEKTESITNSKSVDVYNCKFYSSNDRPVWNGSGYTWTYMQQDGTSYDYYPGYGPRMLTRRYLWTGNSSNSTTYYYEADGCFNYYQITELGGYITAYYSGDVKTYSVQSTTVKGDSSYGFLSSSSASAYPNNSYSGSYWYVKSGQDTLDPSAITYDTPQGGQLLDISITPSAGKVYGGTTYYKYEYSLDGGTSWNVANESTTAETISVLVPYGSASFTARVTASDDLGFTSADAVTGETLTVINNAAPVITCGVTDLGTVEAGFTVDYSISDSDGDTVTVDITLDGAKIQSGVTPTGGGGTGSITIDSDRFLRLLNGAHTLEIVATDAQGAVATHSIAFVKAVYRATITLETPMDADDRIRLMVLNITGQIPADAVYTVEVTNNAYDDSPVWEDITNYVKNKYNYEFSNTVCAAGKWGFNFRITISRGESVTGGYIEAVSGGYEG